MKQRTVTVLMFALAAGIGVLAQTPQGTPMPYTAIHQPEFVAAAEATFLEDDDILLGVASGKMAKAFPAADLSQHGADATRVAYPFSALRIARVVNDRVGGLPIVIVHQPSSDTTTAFDARARGKVLRFQAANDDASSVIDLETRSTWNAYGLALEGAMKGTQLKQVMLVPQFLFVTVPIGDQGLHGPLRGEEVTMQDRRTFLGIAAASLLPIGIDAQTGAPAARTQRSGVETSAPRPPAELARHALTGPLEGFEAVLVELNIPPGPRSSGPGHRHPGPVLGYVVEGQMRFGINHEPEQVVPVGGTFFEPSGAVHTTLGSARTDGPTRVVVFMMVPKGSPLTAPA